MYQCPRCGFTTKLKNKMNKHIYGKKECKAKIEDVNVRQYINNIDELLIISNFTLIKKIKQISIKLEYIENKLIQYKERLVETENKLALIQKKDEMYQQRFKISDN